MLDSKIMKLFLHIVSGVLITAACCLMYVSEANLHNYLKTEKNDCGFEKNFASLQLLETSARKRCRGEASPVYLAK